MTRKSQELGLGGNLTRRWHRANDDLDVNIVFSCVHAIINIVYITTVPILILNLDVSPSKCTMQHCVHCERLLVTLPPGIGRRGKRAESIGPRKMATKNRAWKRNRARKMCAIAES